MKFNEIKIGMLAVFASFSLGCAGYHVGTTNGRTAGARSVQVKFFDNETFEPRLATAVNRAMKREFQKDGTFSLETQSEGDLVVTGKLIGFRRNGVSYKPGDVPHARRDDRLHGVTGRGTPGNRGRIQPRRV